MRSVYAALLAAGVLAFAGTADAQSSNMRGAEVRQVQQALVDAGYDIQVDGAWGPNSRQALRDYQQKNGLDATGRPDSDTLAALNIPTSSGMYGSSGGSMDQSPAAGGEAGVNHMGSAAKGSRTKTDTLNNPSTVR